MDHKSSFRKDSVNSVESMDTSSCPADEEKTYEYETQHFGFTPKAFCDGVYNAVLEYIADALEKSDKYIQNEMVLQGFDSEGEKDACDSLFDMIKKRSDKTFAKLESYVERHIFHIPRHVLLPEDSVHEANLKTELIKQQDEQMDEEIRDLKTRITAMKYMNETMSKEIREIGLMQEKYSSFLSEITELEGTKQNAAFSYMSEHLMMACEQAKKLKHLMAVHPQTYE